MLGVYLKHIIYEKSIEVLFQQLEQNFVLPDTIDSKLLALIKNNLPVSYTLTHAYVENGTGDIILQLEIGSDIPLNMHINLNFNK